MSDDLVVENPQGTVILADCHDEELHEKMDNIQILFLFFIAAIKKRTISSLHSPFLTPMTPQTQAAKVLARIGDEVMDQYEEQLEKSVAVLLRYSENLTYDTFRDIASNVVDQDLPGWRQVGVMLRRLMSHI